MVFSVLIKRIIYSKGLVYSYKNAKFEIMSKTMLINNAIKELQKIKKERGSLVKVELKTTSLKVYPSRQVVNSYRKINRK